MKRLIVTGASGLIGRHVIEHLPKNLYDIHALCRNVPSERTPGITWHSVDLLDRSSTGKCIESISATHLAHLAWFTTPDEYWISQKNKIWVEASHSLAELFLKSGGRHIFAAGSCAEYAWRNQILFENGSPLEPASIYGFAKKHCCELLAATAKRHGAGFTWGRVFFLYGPGEHPERLVPSAVRSLLNGQTFTVQDGDRQIDLLHVDDVASAFVKLIEGNVPGVFNVSSGFSVSIREIAEAVGDVIGRKELIGFDQPELSETVSVMVAGDNTRLKSTGWLPRMNIRRGLEDTVAWIIGR